MDYQPVKPDTLFRGRKRKRTLIVALVTIVILIAIGVGVYFLLRANKTATKKDLTKTNASLEVTRTILGNLDNTIDPCDDFYQFACGGFLKTATIPETSTINDAFTTQTNVIDKQIHTILTEPIMANDSPIVQIVKKLYGACMNETAIEKESMPTIKRYLKKLGGWPVLEGSNWNEYNFDLYETILSLKNEGMFYSTFLDFSVDTDPKNSTRKVLTLDQPFISFEHIKRGPRNNHILNANHKFMTKVAEAFGAKHEVAEKEMNEIISLDMEVAKILIPQEERRDLEDEYHPFTIKELASKYPFFPWYNFTTRFVAPTKITNKSIIIVTVPKYLDNLSSLIQRTSKRKLANYVLYKAVGSLVPYAGRKLRQIQLEFSNATLSLGKSRPRTEQCTTIVTSRLDIAIGALYIRKYFNKDAKSKTEEIVQNIEHQFVKILEKVDWMDQNTRKAALEKLAAMEKYIGYPDELMDDSKLEELYKSLQINSNNYVEIMLNISKYERERENKQLAEPVIKSDWRSRSSVAVVNAFYDLNGNAIQVPAGILQGIFFNAERPEYLNYGAIGYIIGHEFTHGFDDQGSQMDKDGNLREWWSENIKKAYDARAQCIVSQYSNLVAPEVNITVNGVNTQGENIADNGGIKLAYLAYQEWVSENDKEEKLPKLDYTPNQMYWLGAANAWCTKIRPAAMAQEIMSEVHPPERFRINVPFANSGYFAKDFNCPKGSNMNPLHTCTVW